jgi:hypothetical protein
MKERHGYGDSRYRVELSAPAECHQQRHLITVEVLAIQLGTGPLNWHYTSGRTRPERCRIDPNIDTVGQMSNSSYRIDGVRRAAVIRPFVRHTLPAEPTVPPDHGVTTSDLSALHGSGTVAFP